MSCSDHPERGGGKPALLCFAVAFAFLLATHLPFLDLPYHWDELGYFIPAAHDLMVSGALVPHSTPPNVHPPLVMLYLAGIWKLFGFAVPVTRVAMLAAGAGAIASAFLLARLLAGTRAAIVAAGLMAVSPPFVAQSMLAHLDLSATVWALLAIYWFLTSRWWLCGVAMVLLVLTKETGIIVPAVLALFRPDGKRRVLPLIVPFAALACWLVYLRSVTGHWLGNAEFERYNVDQAVVLARIPLVLLRRLYQIGFANFHWIAAVVIGVAVTRRRMDPAWRPLAAVAAGYLLVHSVLGGAILLRYLLPAMALFYVLTAAALQAAGPRVRTTALAVLLPGLAVANWWNPPYPFGYEDNLAVLDFVRLQQQAANWISDRMPDHTVTTAWPLTDALSNPLSGYVSRPVQVRGIENFQPAAWNSITPENLDVVVVYSRSWEPESGWQTSPLAARMLERYFGYVPQLSREELMTRFRLRSAARWERRGQWIEVFTAAQK